MIKKKKNNKISKFKYFITGTFLIINFSTFLFGRRRKINSKKYYNNILFNISITSLLSTFGFDLISNRLTNSSNTQKKILDTILILIINDKWFYWFHRVMHRNKLIKKYIHNIHHGSKKPYPLDYIYVNPIELLLGNIGYIIPILFFKLDIISFWLSILFRQIDELYIHSSKNKKNLGIICSPYSHYLHHEKGGGNYASMFIFWDKIMGTTIK